MKLHILKVEQSGLDMFVSTTEYASLLLKHQTGVVVLFCHPSALEAEPTLAHRKMECSVGCLETLFHLHPSKIDTTRYNCKAPPAGVFIIQDVAIIFKNWL